jgi:hypothetical protein
MKVTALVVALASLLFGCGSASRRDSHASPSNQAPDAGGGAPMSEWTTLITADWSVPAGSEEYVCARKTVTDDMFVAGFEAVNPLGTHHTLLTMGDPTSPDGVTACSASDNRTLSVFGSGVGTNPLNFPDGVALKITQGMQLNLNLHLFNVGAQDLPGTSGTRVRAVASADVVHIAEGVLAGTVNLNIPPGQTTTSIGHCSMSADVTLFAIAPHMHQLGIYEKVVAESSAQGEVTLHDAPYDFNSQSYHLIDPPLYLAKGDRVRVECTHHNTTDKTVTFGQSTLSEMCFAGIYRYPASGASLICDDNFAGGSMSAAPSPPPPGTQGM